MSQEDGKMKVTARKLKNERGKGTRDVGDSLRDGRHGENREREEEEGSGETPPLSLSVCPLASVCPRSHARLMETINALIRQEEEKLTNESKEEWIETLGGGLRHREQKRRRNKATVEHSRNTAVDHNQHYSLNEKRGKTLERSQIQL
ncbi:hypothetical protein IRJ41_008420 [Triplophysa rosa]|uniref:Uncharacterized protein n=1 Tax=Triplophysa rosa TaxID=992332 RepID=A0A9W7WIY6_TRIRA|nr:hypothetical protein IRJ41_008420 [Triplophysa rosa]